MATKRQCCIRFCCSCFSLPNEKEHDHTSAGARSSPSAIDSPIENPISGSNLNVSGAEAQVSESSNVPLISEGDNVNANQNVSGPPGCNEAPSSSSSSGAIKSGLLSSIRHTDIAKVDGKYVVDVDKLIEHISDLFRQREEEKHLHQNASIPRNFRWPDDPGLTNLKKILPFGTDLRNLNELLSAGLKCVSDLKDIISGPVKTFLRDIGQVSIATAGLLVVAYTLERFDDLSTNKEKCWELLKEMRFFATVVKRLKENSKGMQDVIEEETTALLVEGAIMCCAQIDRSAWKRFFETSKIKADLSDIRQKLNVKYNQINIEIDLLVLSAIGRSPLSIKYPKHAVGIDKSITDVRDLLECESEEKAVTVILHGFGGMGKTTLASAVFFHAAAVFSQVGGCRYSHVQLFKDIDSKPDIEKLQTDILKDLMEPGEAVPDIRQYENGQQELRERLEKVHAFIYIDNVLKGDALKKLLPPDMNTAKKVRFLLTARDEHVKFACPRSDTAPKIYKMEGIQHPEAMLILKKEIKEGINGDQFKNIIEICGGSPLMLTLTAPLIGRAENKKEAYATLIQEKDKWASEDFNEMRCAFAYDALPDDCKDPLLDICSYFKGWDWDRVEDIVGKDKLQVLEERALVTRTTNVVASVRRRKSSSRTTNVVASVHDVILTLARQKSVEESKDKEVRLTFTSASKLKEFLKGEGAEGIEGIKGIWLSDNKDALEISATTLDLMSKSLRVLQLGIFTKVEGKCGKIFNKLVFFEAKITQLPFRDVSKLKQLRYLSYEPNDLNLSKMPSSLRHMELQMPSSLRHMEFDGSSHSHAFQIFSTDLERLGNLRILRLVNFLKLTNLPEGLGDQLSGLQELSLSHCQSIEKLPDSISNLRSLRILKMERCHSLTELPVNFGSLSSLQELDLFFCSQLKALPHSVEKLSSLTLLNLSCCCNLLNLPPGLGNLTSLVELDLMRCKRLESIPESIGELKQLRVLCMSQCDSLKELPRGFCNLSSITDLSMGNNPYLKKLPDGFGQLASLKELYFEECWSLELPEGFGQLRNLEVLFLKHCRKLRELCNDFHCLSSLHNLDLSGCHRLEKLPEDFHCLTSLQRLNLSYCPKLEGRSMDHMVKMNRLQVVHIEESEQLVKRWAEIQRDGLWSFTVISGQESEKENIENHLLSELDRLLTNGQKEPFRVSDLLPNTLVIWDVHRYKDNFPYNFPWPLIEETINEMQIEFKIIYIGSDFDKLPTKVKDSIFVVDLPETGAYEMLHKVCLTLDTTVPGSRYSNATWYLQMHTKMVGEKSDKYRPCWRFLTAVELEEIVVGNSRRYLRLKQLVETKQKSNIKLLRELFAPEGDETTPVFQKNESSRQDTKEKLEQKTACGVDKLEGKTILLEMRPIPSRYDTCKSFYDIRLQSLKAMYEVEKDLEIISIPLVDPGDEYDALDLYRQFSREVPWFVLQNSWMVMTSVVKFFFAKHCRWEEGEECENLYSTINWIIEPNGRIIIYTPSICLKEKGEVFKVLFHYLESETYQLRWGVKASTTMYEKIEKLRKEEWKQLKNMSNLDFLFNHLESAQVKKSMFQGKLICLYTAGKSVPCDILNALEHFRDSIYIIYISYNFSKNIGFTKKFSKDYSLKIFPENTNEMTLSILSIDETVRFAMRLHHLEEEINGMDESDKQLCELKSLLHSVHGDPNNGSITFMDERGGMVAAFRGRILESILRADRAERVIKSMMEDFGGGGGKEMHDHDPGVSESLIKNMQTAVEQENMDVYLDSLRNYISELRGVELYQLLKLLNVNKEAKKWSRPKVTWPTSRSFCMLKDFLSEGTDADWVKDVFSRHPEEETKWKPVINSLLSGIEEANWAVAGLLAVADVLERLETVSANQMRVGQIDSVFILHAMLRLAPYIGQVNQKPGLWRNIKRVATALILVCGIVCCDLIDPFKFSWLELGIDRYTVDTRPLEEGLIKQCDLIAKAITEGLDESGSLIKQMCAGLEDYLETFCEEESEVSSVKVCL